MERPEAIGTVTMLTSGLPETFISITGRSYSPHVNLSDAVPQSIGAAPATTSLHRGRTVKEQGIWSHQVRRSLSPLQGCS
nr:uncharacterized protein CTRU02_06765 [Colletotrichum truncatum]KAF6792148.1 hypothetical protein CTRU02_06765 [Colletotrichum truncatum]